MTRRRFNHPPKCASCFGMNSCISDNNFAISAESFVMEQSSSEWKSGAICLQSRSWLITFPRLLGPTAELSGDGEQKQGITRDVRERARNLFNCFYLFLFPRERQSAREANTAKLRAKFRCHRPYRNSPTWACCQLEWAWGGDTSAPALGGIIALGRRAVSDADYLGGATAWFPTHCKTWTTLKCATTVGAARKPRKAATIANFWWNFMRAVYNLSKFVIHFDSSHSGAYRPLKAALKYRINAAATANDWQVAAFCQIKLASSVLPVVPQPTFSSLLGNSHGKSVGRQIGLADIEAIKNLRDLRTNTFGVLVSARSLGSNLLNCGKFSLATLIDSTHARLVFLICARSSGQSCLSWPMWISISRNDATCVLISINICNLRKLDYHGSWFMCAGGCSRPGRGSGEQSRSLLMSRSFFGPESGLNHGWAVRINICENQAD